MAYLPLGAGLIVAPWNFPLAILAGMTSAAIVTGNTVVVKPASLAPVVAARFVDLLAEAGLPGVVELFPAPAPRSAICWPAIRASASLALPARATSVSTSTHWRRRCSPASAG